MRQQTESTADQRALDRAGRRERVWQPGATQRQQRRSHETIRHYNEDVKFITRRAPR